MPAQAGIHHLRCPEAHLFQSVIAGGTYWSWIPAYAGMTLAEGTVRQFIGLLV